MRVRLTVAYNGAGFHGFAINPGVRTVGGVLGDAIGRYVGHPVELTCAGRTDAGVHARSQTIHFTTTGTDLEGLVKAVNRMCRPEIVVSEPAIVSEDFHARFSCVSRTYRYLILNQQVADPLQAHMSWHVNTPLDIDKMTEAAQYLVGTHDFSSFCRRPSPDTDLTRHVHRLDLWREQDNVVIEIEAKSFCHQMVRSIVALLTAIGTGKRPISAVKQALEAKNRDSVPSPAPPHGLTLHSTHYNPM